MKKMTIEEMGERGDGFRLSATREVPDAMRDLDWWLHAELWRACIQVCMRLDEMAAERSGGGQEVGQRIDSLEEAVANLDPGWWRGVGLARTQDPAPLAERVDALEAKLGALDRLLGDYPVAALQRQIEEVQHHLGMGDTRHDGESPLRLDRLDLLVDELRRANRDRIAKMEGAVDNLDRRLADHLEKSKRTFPTALGPNPEPLRAATPERCAARSGILWCERCDGHEGPHRSANCQTWVTS